MHAYILLDRSGSMENIWSEALSSVNTYAGDLRTLPSAQITFAVFDHYEGAKVDVLRRGVTAEAWTDVTESEASPRGGTPLFDAIGRMIAMAEADAADKTVLVIMTDGHENQSREMTKESVTAAIARVEAKGWQVVFLGANFAEFDDARAIGMSRGKTMAMKRGKMKDAMSRLGAASVAFSMNRGDIEFGAEDRAVAGEAEVEDKR